MKRLVYVSRPCEGLSDKAVEQIILFATKHNYSRHISGCLIYDKNIFVQYLEGKGSDVDYLLERIQMDSRHSDLRVIYSDYVYNKARLFKNWSMMYQRNAQLKRVNKALSQKLEHLKSNLNGSDYTDTTDKEIIGLMISLAENHGLSPGDLGSDLPSDQGPLKCHWIEI